jgi:hypothetical protein
MIVINGTTFNNYSLLAYEKTHLVI